MSDKTTIQWADHTFNPWEGCKKVSPGCAHCYAEARNKRFGGDNWGLGKPRRRTSAANWRKPLKWNRDAGLWHATPRPSVFCASIADWLDDEVPIEWLADLLTLILRKTSNLDWQLLTKRPENWRKRLEQCIHKTHCDPTDTNDLIAAWLDGHRIPANIWIGTSVEDQQRADERIPHLLKIPAKVRFLSVEPLLSEVSIFRYTGPSGNPAMPHGVNWVIVGGESGPRSRACHIEWIDSIVKQCASAGVPCFVKQMGANTHCGNANVYDWPEETRLVDSCCIEGFAACGVHWRDKKGGDPAEWPDGFNVRQFPI